MPAWFDKFRHDVCNVRYGQCNGDHTLFYRDGKGKITIFAIYVDDIIINEKAKIHVAGIL